MKTITFKVPYKLNAELNALAREKGLSKSQILRQALEAHVKRKRGKKALRAFDLIGDLAGSVKGPGDLLTNPRYMDDFGK